MQILKQDNFMHMKFKFTTMFFKKVLKLRSEITMHRSQTLRGMVISKCEECQISKEDHCYITANYLFKLLIT